MNYGRQIAFWIGLPILHGVLILVYLNTRGSWYNPLDLKEQVAFWTAFAVAYGTLALALVTLVSVQETQRVVVGEDRRFRASRMPMVKLLSAKTTVPSGYTLKMINNGDGPAMNVRVSFAGMVRYDLMKLSTTALTNVQRSSYQKYFNAERVIVTSHLGVKEECTLFLPDEQLDGMLRNGIPSSITQTLPTIDLCEIYYNDQFDEMYATQYGDNAGVSFDVANGIWKRPQFISAVPRTP